MRTNRSNDQELGRDDEAVSPVIAVILMVAITVVLAATVYVWVSGFGQSGEQAPAASFKITGCTASSDTVTVKLLSSSQDLTLSDLKAVLNAEQVTGYSEGDQLATEDPMASSGTWSVGQSQSIDYSGQFSMTDDDGYVLDIVHTPSGTIIGSPTFTC